MDIVIGKYKLVPSPHAPNVFDIIEMTVATATEKSKSREVGEEYDAEYVCAYGVTLTRSIEFIIGTGLSDIKEESTLPKYLSAWTKEKEEIKKLLEDDYNIKII